MDYGLKIAYALLTAGRPLTTKEIVNRVGCERKTVPHCIDDIERAGFVTEVSKVRNSSGHGFSNLYSCRMRCEL